MANTYTFETSGTAAQSLTSADTLNFATTSVSPSLTATYTDGATTAQDTITLSNGTTTLTFNADSLRAAAAAGQVHFFDGSSGTLVFGSDSGTAGPPAVAGDTLTDPTDTSHANAFFAFGGGTDTITFGGTGNHIVYGGAGVDTIALSGGTNSGNYWVEGGSGADTINLSGATGNLHVYGGTRLAVAGTTADSGDTITVGTGSNYVNGNAGADTISVAAGSTKSNTLFGGADNDTITGGGGNDSINGNVGNDSLSGGAGDDIIRGGQGNDQLFGGDGNDQLFGDIGNDTLTGGAGIDVLTGGTGSDTFVFHFNAAVAGPPAVAAYSDAPVDSSAASLNGGVTSTNTLPKGYFDVITDFKANGDADKIDLDRVTASGANPIGANLKFVTDASFNTEAAAQQYAAGVLTQSATAASTTVHDVVAIQVGADTFLFSHENTSAVSTTDNIDTIIKLANFTATTLSSTDFI